MVNKHNESRSNEEGGGKVKAYISPWKNLSDQG